MKRRSNISSAGSCHKVLPKVLQQSRHKLGFKATLTATAITGAILLGGCHGNKRFLPEYDADAAAAKAMNKSYPMSVYKKLAPFNKIRVAGPFNVKLLSSDKHMDVRVIGSKDYFPHILAYVEDGTLILRLDDSMRWPKHAPLTAIIRAPAIHKIAYTGYGNIEGIGFRSPIMDLALNTNGHVNLKGHMGINDLILNGHGVITIDGVTSDGMTLESRGSDEVYLNGTSKLKRLVFGGHSWISAHWITGDEVNVEGYGDAYAQLAGKVDVMLFEIRNKADFNARYLRTRKLFGKTYNYARADVHVSDSQNTLARNNSNIYYYGKPDHVASYDGEQGSVINMHGFG